MKINTRNLNKEFCLPDGKPGTRALEGIDFCVAEGEFVVFLGPSGCGKTTLLNILAGFEKPTRGKVSIDGKPVNGPHPRRILMWQFFGLFPWRTVRGNIEFGLEIKGINSSTRKEISSKLIYTLGLSGFAHSYPGEISGGMKQRVALARVIAVDPEIFFMDEPFGSVDATIRRRLENMLLDILRDKKRTVVFVTHNVREALYLADRVFIMSANPGKIVHEEKISWSKPRSASQKEFRETEELLFHYLHSQTRFEEMEGI